MEIRYGYWLHELWSEPVLLSFCMPYTNRQEQTRHSFLTYEFFYNTENMRFFHRQDLILIE